MNPQRSPEPNDDVVVITGASGGIGAALARRLARDGKRLVLAARRKSELGDVAREAEGLGAKGTLVVSTDVTNRNAVMHLRDAAIDKFGGIDIWINNAGRGITRPVLDLTDADIDDMISTNLKSALYGMQAAVPHFIARDKGHLINISTFLSRVPVASHRSAYSASKAALNSLTANLRMDLLRLHPNIHVSLVMPGVVTTDFATNANTPDALRADLPTSKRPGPQPQTPEQVADRIADLIENPAAEIYTNPSSQQMARDYYSDVAAFEDRLTQHNT